MTIAELMIIIAIIGIMTAVAIPMYTDYHQRSLLARAEADLLLLDALIAEYSAENNTLPDSLDDLGAAANLTDPWGNRYRYLNLTNLSIPGKARKHAQIGRINTDYDLYSVGKDGASQPPLTAAESWDDVIRGNNGRYVGLASAY